MQVSAPVLAPEIVSAQQTQQTPPAPENLLTLFQGLPQADKIELFKAGAKALPGIVKAGGGALPALLKAGVSRGAPTHVQADAVGPTQVRADAVGPTLPDDSYAGMDDDIGFQKLKLFEYFLSRLQIHSESADVAALEANRLRLAAAANPTDAESLRWRARVMETRARSNLFSRNALVALIPSMQRSFLLDDLTHTDPHNINMPRTSL